MASAIKFGKHLRELRFHLCQRSDESKELRNFIEKCYVAIKSNNPNVPILIRECSNTLPKVYARYDYNLNNVEYGKEKSVSLNGKSCDEILKQVDDLAKV